MLLFLPSFAREERLEEGELIGNYIIRTRYERIGEALRASYGTSLAASRSFSLQVFVWPPSTETMIHDHSSWGVYCCAVGAVVEERYERLDDGSRPHHAHLRKVWQLLWSTEDGASSVLPHDGGIHRVGNPTDSVAISAHLYGPRIGEVDGRDYDPSRAYVCDRLEI